MDFRILGELQVLCDDRPLDLGSPRQQALLARLLISANEVVSSDRLLEDLWPYDMPDTARQILHVYVSRLRRSLGDERQRLERRGIGYCLKVDGDELDSATFARLATEGARAAGDGDTVAAQAALTTALSLWRGPALSDFPDDPFAREEAVRLERIRVDVLEQRLWADLGLGREGYVVEELRGLVAIHPLREAFWEQLMLALYRCGQQADALRAYEAARLYLATELGIEPGPALQSLELRILDHDTTLDVGVRHQPRSARLKVPAERTSFVGRTNELDRATSLLEHTRLLTIVGSPGAGKTRLAIRLASRVAPLFRDGVTFVPLASVRSTDFVHQAIASELGLRLIEDEDPTVTLHRHLGDVNLLLILDNFEQLIDGIDIIGGLLDASPEVVVIVTSRVPLRITGEQRFPIPPMATPTGSPEGDPGSLAEYEAVRLFVERAQSVDPSFELTDDNASAVGMIVQHLDGLPLAIELAAARVQDLDPFDLAARLDDRLGLLTDAPRDAEDRHQTMGAAIRWSAELLSRDDRRAFRSLGVFLGGFTLDAAAEVIGCDPDEAGVTVETLVSHNLIDRPGWAPDGRYAMLELIREYALAELNAHDELRGARQRHGEYFVDLAQRLERSLARDPGGGSGDRLRAELANIRSVLWFATDAPDAELGLTLAASIWRFWLTVDQLDEGRRWLETLLALDGGSSSAKARGLSALGGIAYWQGAYEASRDSYLAALELFRAYGDQLGEANTRYALSTTSIFLDDLDAGENYAVTARRMFKDLGNREGVGGTYMAQGHAEWWRGDHERALELFREALVCARETDDGVFASTVLVGVAVLEHLLDNREHALEVIVQAAEEAAELDNAHSVVWSLDVLAAMAVDRSPESAVTLAGAAESLRDEAGGGWTSETLGLENARHAASRHIDGEQIERAWQEGSVLSIDAAMERARHLGARSG